MGVAAGAIAAVGLVNFGKDITNLASSAEQSMGGVEAVFKNYASAVKDNAKSAAGDLGLSANAYRELATVIGSQLKNAGVPMEELGGKTDKLVSQGADLAAMFGGTTQEAVDALSSALKGEMDPIEKYGISLNDAALKAEAMSLGLYSGKGNLDANAKAMAVMSLVTKQGADSIGAFGRESDTAAGRQQRATAQWENLKTTIGEKLLPVWSGLMDFVGGTALPGLERIGGYLVDTLGPVFSEISGGIRAFAAAWKYNDGEITSSGFPGFMERLGFIVRTVFGEITGGIKAFAAAWKYNDGEVTSSGFPGFMERLGFIARQVFDYVRNTVIPALIDFGGWIARNADIILPFIAALGAGYVVFQTITAITRAWAAAQAALNVVMAMNPIGLIIVAIAALVAGLVIAYQRSETFREIVDGAFRAVAAAGSWMWDNVLKPVFSVLANAWSAVATGIGWAWDNIIKPAWTAIVGYVTFMWGVLQPIFTFIWDLWTTVANAIFEVWRGVILVAWTALSAYIGFMWDNVLKPIFGFIGAGWSLLASGISWVYDNVIRPVWGRFQSGIEALQGVFETVKNAIGRIWDGLVDKVKTPIRVTFDFVNDRMIGPVNSILGKFPGNLSIPRLPQLASGGLLRGPGTGTSDSILGVDPRSGVPTAAVSNGEFVVRATQTKKHLGLLRAINEGVGQFAGGGLVERFGVKGHFLGDIIDDAGDLVGSAWNATKGAVSAVGNFAKDMVAKGARKAAELILKPIRDAAVGLIPNKVPMSLLSGGIDRLYNAVLGKGDEQDQAMAAVKKLAGPVTANGVGGLGPAAARAHAFVRSNWGFQGTIGGYANRNIAGTNVKSKHALGKAIDVMTLSNMGLGQSIADFFAGPGRGTFGVDNVIWNRRIHSGRGWGGYSGVSPHTDHPHIDFYKTGTSYVPHDGPAILHKGEAVIPADVNARGFGQPIVINIKGTFDLASSGDLRRAAVTMERELVKLQREKR